MKKILCSILSTLILLFLLLKPTFFSQSIILGIHLCISQVIPALLPMILLTNYMQKKELCTTLSHFLHPLLRFFFGVTNYGSYAVIVGFLCGFPVASKTISQLQKNHSISKEEALFLTGFCNNCSFSFVANYIGFFCLQNRIPIPTLLSLIYLPPLFCGFINHFFYNFTSPKCPPEPSRIDIIPDTFFTLLRISTYVILFTTLTSGLAFLHIPWHQQISSLLEITSGLNLLTQEELVPPVLINVFLCTVFGGFCSMLQCFSFLKETDYRLSYILGKLEQIILLFLFLLFLNR